MERALWFYISHFITEKQNREREYIYIEIESFKAKNWLAIKEELPK